MTKIDLLIQSLKSDDFVPDPKLSPEQTEILQYFMVVESLTSVTYAPLVRWLPAYLIPDLRKFVNRWDCEEGKHGQVLKLYLEKHNCPITIQPEETLGLMYWLEVVFIIGISWVFWFISIGSYLIVGAVNESMTSAGYWALMQKIKDQPLLLEIIHAIQKEEVNHLNTYSRNAKKYLPFRWQRFMSKKLLPLFLNPIGSKHGDVAKLVRYLLADGTDRGFYSRFKRNLEEANEVVDNVRDRMVTLIRDIQFAEIYER